MKFTTAAAALVLFIGTGLSAPTVDNVDLASRQDDASIPAEAAVMAIADEVSARDLAPRADDDDVSIAGFTVQLCLNANWVGCVNLWVEPDVHYWHPLTTFGSYNVGSHKCHCRDSRGVYSNEFSGSKADVRADYGDHWFYNCDVIGCWD